MRTQGIESIDARDLAFARQLGYAIRHLGFAQRSGGEVETCVFPALVPLSNLLANVRGVTNAVEVTSRALGKSLYIGAGAGAMPTANSVLSDILDIAGGEGGRPLAGHAGCAVSGQRQSSSSAYYVRIQADDKTGVLARLTEVLANEGVGIDSLLQPEAGSEASIVLITHLASEASIRQALDLIESLPEVRGAVSLMRIHDDESS